MQHLHILNIAVISMPPDRAHKIPHRTDEVLIKQHTISDIQATSAIEGAYHAQSLRCISSNLVDVY